jgi:hypothetical protein
MTKLKNRFSDHKLRGFMLFAISCISLLGVITFLSFSDTSAQGLDPVNFTGCVSNTGNNATIAIPATAPQMHTRGYFVPVAGDEFAVFRPVDGTCATTADSLCAGVIVWQEVTDALTVWGDNSQTIEYDGMRTGEEMCWRVWDASEDKVYTATVAYNPNPPFIANGLYTPNGLYALETLSPTAVRVTSFRASGISNSFYIFSIPSLVVIMGSILIISRKYRK